MRICLNQAKYGEDYPFVEVIDMHVVITCTRQPASLPPRTAHHRPIYHTCPPVLITSQATPVFTAHRACLSAPPRLP